MVELIARHQVRSFVMVNTVLAMVVEESDAAADFSSLEGVIVGGGALSLNSARQTIELFGCPLYSMYGSTELTFGVPALRLVGVIARERVVGGQSVSACLYRGGRALIKKKTI